MARPYRRQPAGLMAVPRGVRRAPARAAALVGAGHDARRAACGWRSWWRSRRPWPGSSPAWPCCCRRLGVPGVRRARGSSSPAAAPRRPGPDRTAAPRRGRPRWTPTRTRRLAGRRGRRPRLPAAPALPQARGPGRRSPTRPTRRRTGWSRPGTPTGWPPPWRGHGGSTPVGRGDARDRSQEAWPHGIRQLEDVDRPLTGRCTRCRRRREEGPQHVLARRHRQEPARQPRRPRRRPLGGRGLGRRQRHGDRDRPDAGHPQGRRLLREVDRPPAAGPAEGRPGRRRRRALRRARVTADAGGPQPSRVRPSSR